MEINDRLEQVEQGLRNWAQGRMDRLDAVEMEAYRGLCDELMVIRRALRTATGRAAKRERGLFRLPRAGDFGKSRW